MGNGMDNLAALEDRVIGLLDRHRDLQDENRALQEQVASHRDRVAQLEHEAKRKEELLAVVEGRIDLLLQKLSDVSFPNTPLLPGGLG
ncbi:MAG: cell division protein ZapB [Deltaproteobacteria bacterium]|nr:cell division protein ZapB [Candidatus Anaeroferrophillus wilburensis]MBN2889962.1 cell division protein ZapB [Deltaproteobacteria bacterium]